MKAGYADGDLPLTPAMRAVLSAAAAGRTIKETALELDVSISTVNNIRAAAFSRLGVHSTPAAVYAALTRGEPL